MTLPEDPQSWPTPHAPREDQPPNDTDPVLPDNIDPVTPDDIDPAVSNDIDPVIGAPLIARTELLAGIAVFFGAMIVIGAVLIFRSDTGSDIPGTVASTGSSTPAPSGDTGSVGASGSQQFVVPANADEQAIENLGRLSIILLPEGHWPQLYDDFTADFQARCTAEDFARAGEDAAASLGGSLQLLGFKGLQTLNITGDTATAVIVGELRGQSEYTIEASFAKVDQSWKLAPAPGTEGCSSFNRLSD